MTSPSRIFNVTVLGDAPRTIVLGNGLGTNQDSWRYVVEAIAPHARIIRYDVAGTRHESAAVFNPDRYRTLHGYADDVVAILDELDVTDALFVGHSVSGMIGCLAAAQLPERIARVVTIAASPRYLDDDGYVGGFSRDAIEGLLATAAADYQGWVAGFAPLAIGETPRAELVGEFARYLLAMPPEIAHHLLRTVFLSDHRHELARVSQPVTVVQPRTDVAVPLAVGEYLAERLPSAELHVLPMVGHVPQLTVPELLVPVVRDALDRMPA